ncbi:MAG: hypothetical protein HY332_11525 [Chloroflexi bacterium]|nr:hypothetical protein [Chloroflexota bacterium]
MTEVYVGLARARALAVLDAATDKPVRQIALSLRPEERRGLPGQIGVGPFGNAAVLPLLSTGPDVGIVSHDRSPADERLATRAAPFGPSERIPRSGRRAGAAGGGQRCTWIGVGTGQPRGVRYSAAEATQSVAVDGRGRAYVLVGDVGGSAPSYAAVVELATGTLRRHVPLAAVGESVFALLARPDGERVYAAIWQWDTPFGAPGQAQGRLVELDARSGQVLSQVPVGQLVAGSGISPDAVVTDLALAAPPPGSRPAGDPSALAIYAVVVGPGPSRDDLDWWPQPSQAALVALDPRRLDVLTDWPLDGRPGALAALRDGSRMYLLAGPAFGGGRSRRLVSLDLATGIVTHRWSLPDGCLGLALGPTGKLYVTDLLGDRLWRVDTSTDTFLGDVPLPGGPIAIAARPYA